MPAATNALQEFTFTSKYARFNKEKKRRDTFKEAINRVAEMHRTQFPQVVEEIEWAFARSKEKRVLSHSVAPLGLFDFEEEVGLRT